LYYYFDVNFQQIFAKFKEKTMAIKIDTEKCVGCGACTGTCPVEVLEMKDGKVVYKGEGCIDCGACVSACPVEALSL
jgi:NAD-dependent dihydropyrimidine dehydrogenase PreA subunit